MIETKPRQKWFHTIGDTGCYFLSILHSAERITGKYMDAFAAFMIALSKTLVLDNCWVQDPGGLLSYLTGETWAVTKEAAGYMPRGGEVEILRYEWQKVGETKSHFVCGNGLGEIEYDPYGDSATVANGKLVSKRIFRRVRND